MRTLMFLLFISSWFLCFIFLYSLFKIWAFSWSCHLFLHCISFSSSFNLFFYSPSTLSYFSFCLFQLYFLLCCTVFPSFFASISCPFFMTIFRIFSFLLSLFFVPHTLSLSFLFILLYILFFLINLFLSLFFFYLSVRIFFLFNPFSCFFSHLHPSLIFCCNLAPFLSTFCHSSFCFLTTKIIPLMACLYN